MSTQDDVLTFRSRELSAPLNYILGLPLVLFGGASVWALLARLVKDGTIRTDHIAVALGTALFAPLGLVTMMSLYGARIDRRARTVTVWWGKPFPLWRRAHRLDDFAAVVKDTSRRSGSSGQAPYGHRIYLGGPEKRVLVAAWNSHDVDGGDAVVQRIAAFTGLEAM